MLLREHSLTRAARTLNVTQPALSKTLARLRRYFDDPLFVRVALRMEPTPKALELQAPVRAILERMRSLRSEHVSFDPRTSHRTFNFCVVDAGLIKLLPPLVDRLLDEAPNVRLRVLQLEAQHLEPWLESGKLDFAMGSFPSLTKGIRRQPLWVERYVSVARRSHPRLGASRRCAPSRPRSTCWSRSREAATRISWRNGRWRARSLPENIICRIPMFIGAAIVAKHTDAVATLPLSVAAVLAKDLDLQVITPPIKLPKIDIYQYWHDRFTAIPAINGSGRSSSRCSGSHDGAALRLSAPPGRARQLQCDLRSKRAPLRQQLVAGDHRHHQAARGFDHHDAVVELHEFMALHERDLAGHAGRQVLHGHPARQRIRERGRRHVRDRRVGDAHHALVDAAALLVAERELRGALRAG